MVLDGEHSYMKNKVTGQTTKIHYEDGQYVLYLWLPSGPKGEEKTAQPLGENRFATLAADEEQGFTQVRRK